MTERPQGLWLWVAKPDYTQDYDGADREELEPGYESPEDGWWTCDEATRDGDLALLYRTAPFSEVHWLLKTCGNRYSIANDLVARREGWRWGTAYEVLASFPNTITFSEMANSQPLMRWDAIDRKLHGGDEHPGAWPVPMVYWRTLITRLISRNPRTKAIVAKHMRPSPSWLV